jgi:trans-aconitate methyltransferase
MSYDPRTYWTEAPAMKVRPAHEAQAAALMDAVGRKQVSSILEVGCGFGRIGTLLTEKWPNATYMGIDISPDRIVEASANLPADGRVTLAEADLFDFDTDESFDLVVAVEVLMHIPPEQVEDAVERLQLWSHRHIYTVDWDTPIAKTPAPHNFLHDYEALGFEKVASTGLQGIYHLKV